MSQTRSLLAATCLASAITAVGHAQSFVNFESPQVHPVEVTPGGARVLVTNTADNRLEILDRSDDGSLRRSASVPVGLEPVSVRAFDDRTAWVVNHLSDSVTIVDLDTATVSATLPTGDEPADVVFAGSPPRAFVSVSQENRLMVFDPADPAAAPISIPIDGQDPRSLCFDGTSVYAVIFEAGNRTTILSQQTVASSVNPYPGNQSPPPNAGGGFDPPMNPSLPPAPDVSIIVRRTEDGRWLDDNAGDWSDAVTWDLHGHGVAVVDPTTLATTYHSDLLTTNMAAAARPDGGVVVVGTEASNEVRFEPNLAGRFITVEGAIVSPGPRGRVTRRDLNPHLDYAGPTIPFAERVLSIGDPRGVACSPDGQEVWVTGMGSNNVLVLDPSLARVDRLDVGTGPTGIAMDPAGEHVYILNRFEAAVTIIDRSSRRQVGRLELFDPTPAFINEGRPFLYDTHLTSGLGHASCGSCHVDGRIDQLAWDLGDPSGEMKAFDQVCNLDLPIGECEDFHPMKGPMTTQTLTGLEGNAPFHWRGDRQSFAAFDHAFPSLLGADADGTPEEMAAMRSFLASIANPPNPNRLLDGSLPPLLDGADPERGREGFETGELDFIQCVTCHALPSGGLGTVISGDLLMDSQSMKVAPLRNMYEKTGMDKSSMSGSKGFGFEHDGADATLVEFFEREVFTFPGGSAGDQLRRDVSAFMLCWETGTHAGVGAQAEIGGADPDPSALRDLLVSIALAGDADLVARAFEGGRVRGAVLRADGRFQTDVAGEIAEVADLEVLATPDHPVTYTLVPRGSGIRIGIDRDLDGYLDEDEVRACSDPADPGSTPDEASCGPDLDGDGQVDGNDLGLLFSAWGPCPGGPCQADLSGNGTVGPEDLGILLAAWGG
ncbi:MAG: hypothetical protein VX726_13385 [Planctomycetota bacterium]|nr:hypothetical protein [Planctomycetota bacterium]